MKKKKNQTSET